MITKSTAVSGATFGFIIVTEELLCRAMIDLFQNTESTAQVFYSDKIRYC